MKKVLTENYNVEISDNPDYLFFGCFGFNHLKYDCIKIFYTAEDVSPDFNLCDYAIAFDDIKFGDRYLRYPLFLQCASYEIARKKHIVTDEDIESKTGFCNFVYSNSGANPLRTEFFNKLSEYKKVDSGGKYLNNIGHRVEDKYEFQKNYKFTIAFENDTVLDYTTEKIMDAFAAKTIPIYFGNSHISNDFNTESFINCHDYDSFDEIINRVIEIDNNPELYRSILEQPIFKNGIVPEKFSYAELGNFLKNIFDPEIENARRISRYSYRVYYKRNLLDILNVYEKFISLTSNKFVGFFYRIYKNFLTNKKGVYGTL